MTDSDEHNSVLKFEENSHNLSLFHEYLKKTSSGKLHDFWTAIRILITSSHYINRSILFSNNIFSAKFRRKLGFKHIVDLLIQIPLQKPDTFLVGLKNALSTIVHENIPIEKVFENILEDDIDVNDCFIICNENIQKKINCQMQSYDIFLIDVSTNTGCFLAFSKSQDSFQISYPLPYLLSYLDSIIYLHIFSAAYDDERYTKWLETKLFTKICSWTEPRSCINSSQKITSLSLIDKAEYGKLYQEIKQKYGKAMCEIWPDNTDPSKYVYEDIAIATYIMLIWKQDNIQQNSSKKQHFVDLGCGNGLLVHILSSEGYSGFGLDLRKRSLWDKYPKSTQLLEKPFIPTIDTFPDVDWLIGNHSDEITPWLPVVATRSSKLCKYFVIPCCPFELNGKKYQRKNSSNTVYEDFIYYVQNISNICGYETKVDKLRIPSTKRICLIGWNRNMSDGIYADICNTMENFITKECNTMQEYLVREKVERVQNCTQIDKSVQADIVKIIVNKLLDQKETTIEWNSGGTLSVSELAEEIPKALLIRLKSECGGLQTLLKNQNIFKIRDGMVSLNRPKSMHEMRALYIVHKSNDNRVTLKRKELINNKQKGKLKKTEDVNMDQFLQKKDCWYFFHHPQGCPLAIADCSFRH